MAGQRPRPLISSSPLRIQPPRSVSSCGRPWFPILNHCLMSCQNGANPVLLVVPYTIKSVKLQSAPAHASGPLASVTGDITSSAQRKHQPPSCFEPSFHTKDRHITQCHGVESTLAGCGTLEKNHHAASAVGNPHSVALYSDRTPQQASLFR
jgi:hypothetical protein